MFSTTDVKIANPGRWGSGQKGRWCMWRMQVKLYVYMVKFPNPQRANCLPISFRGAFPPDAESFDSASCCSQSYHRRRQPWLVTLREGRTETDPSFSPFFREHFDRLDCFDHLFMTKLINSIRSWSIFSRPGGRKGSGLLHGNHGVGRCHRNHSRHHNPSRRRRPWKGSFQYY